MAGPPASKNGPLVALGVVAGALALVAVLASSGGGDPAPPTVAEADGPVATPQFRGWDRMPPRQVDLTERGPEPDEAPPESDPAPTEEPVEPDAPENVEQVKPDQAETLAPRLRTSPHQSVSLPPAPEIDPDDAKRFVFLVERAYVSLLKGEWAASLDDYDVALEIRVHPDALCNRAYVLVQLGRSLEAVNDCDQALRLDPAHLYARLSLGQARLELGQPLEAAQEFSRVIKQYPATAYAYLGRGTAYLALKKKQAAEEDLALALKLYPVGDPQLDYIKGLLAEARGLAGGGDIPVVAGGDPPALVQRVRGKPQQVPRLSKKEARRLIREWRRAKPEDPRFAILVNQFMHSELPASALADFKNSLRSSSHSEGALQILRMQLQLPEGTLSSAIRENWKRLRWSFETKRQSFPADGEALLELPGIVRANTRAVGRNIELLPDGLLRLSPLPDGLQERRYTLTVRLYLPEGSAGGHSVTIVTKRASSSWEVTAENAKWVVRTSVGDHTTGIVRGWNKIEFTTWAASDARIMQPGRMRSVRIRANESLLLAEGELDGHLEGIEIRAGTTPIVVGGVGLRRNSRGR